MIRRTLLTFLTASMLAGCGTGMPGLTQTLELPTFTLAPGWTSAPAQSHDFPRASSLVARKAGGFALAYDTQKLGGKDVFVSLSADGKTWSAPVAVGQTRRTEESPALWEDASGKLHLIYGSNDSGAFQLYASASTDGKTWNEAVAITRETEHAKAASVTRTPKGVAVVFQTLGGSCEVMQSSDGEIWGLSRRIAASGGDPAIAHDGEGLRVVFHRDGKLFECIERQGSWSEAVQIPGTAEMQEPAIARIAGKLTLAYSTLSSNGTWKLAVREAGPSGWGLEQDLVQGPDDHGYPSLAEGQDGGTWLAWGISRLTEERGIFVARSGGR
ncbi:hypothetical protein D3C72_61480 [compost metagenome]